MLIRVRLSFPGPETAEELSGEKSADQNGKGDEPPSES